MDIIVALAQHNPHVGYLEYNLRLAVAAADAARHLGADLVALPELALIGYPPEDLLHQPEFLQHLVAIEQQFHQALAQIGIDAVYGSVRQQAGRLYNAGVFVCHGQEQGFATKKLLPNYGVFDEQRYFSTREPVQPFTYRGLLFGITICEDIWHASGPVAQLAAVGARWILNLNASPYHVGKWRQRHQVVAQRIAETAIPILYVNQIGGQDELVFDGNSFVMDGAGHLVLRCRSFSSDLGLVRLRGEPGGTVEATSSPSPLVGEGRVRGVKDTDDDSEEREIYAALCLGLHDYVSKNGFSGVVLGLSGGIDSVLTAVICRDALGAAQVTAVMMPSAYTAQESLDDATACADALGIELVSVGIEPLFTEFKRQLQPLFAGLAEDVTEENIQPRIRATLLMALCNKHGRLLVTTGNKSEISMGYATLYGDMAGGFSVLKDLLKTAVYRLARARNRWAEQRCEAVPIPTNVLVRPPTAELKPGQKDSDTLPPYPILDHILHLYVEKGLGIEAIVAAGIDRVVVRQVLSQVDRSEYKRRQAPPGVRITTCAFGRDRRYPITNGFRFPPHPLNPSPTRGEGEIRG
ncbi:MAG: NAD+ synthase [Magnetococcales bacterium]|nr:NAD+ synthase [Magnetococcales bacterium]